MYFKGIEYEFIESDLIHGVMVITPQKAQELLDTSLGNRHESEKRIHMFANDMKAGKWLLNGETITIGEHGDLRNGHHRLYAIIESGIPQKCLVVFNVKDEDSAVYDITRPRDLADLAKLNGLDTTISNKGTQALVRFHYRIQHGLSSISYNDFAEFADRNIDLIEKVYHICLTSNCRVVKKTSVAYAVFCALACGVPEQVLRQFVSILPDGIYTSLEETSAAKLREYVLLHNNPSHQERVSILFAAETAIRDFYNGRPRKKSYGADCNRYYSNQKIVKCL